VTQHQRQIIHRDLKSENIFVVYGERGEIQALALGDFDQSRRGDGTSVVGTPGMIAPEVLAGGATYTAAVDIYSLGIVVYEMMALERPYANMSYVQIAQEVTSGKRPALPEHVRSASQWASTIELFERMTETSASARPSLDAIDRALDQILRDVLPR